MPGLAARRQRLLLRSRSTRLGAALTSLTCSHLHRQVLAFGQTGSGKTHTLLGEVGHPQERGIVPRAVAELARGIAASPDPRAFRVTLSVVEIYCERIKGEAALPIRAQVSKSTLSSQKLRLVGAGRCRSCCY